MRNLANEINEQRKKSVFLKELAATCNDYEKSKELRKLQDKEYKKFIFLKELNKEMGKK